VPPSTRADRHPDPCQESELACAYLLDAVAPEEISGIEAHLTCCARCQAELEAVRPLVPLFAYWPTDVLRPFGPRMAPRAASRLTHVVEDAGEAARLATDVEDGRAASRPSWREPDWKQVAPGIECKILSNDEQTHTVSMLVRLAPGAKSPPHQHAGVEELHLLDGELWINERNLRPGDYNRSERGTRDRRVWSETGCTCVLVTSTDDLLA
jgi:quercetin dioxygenase-like cupin family protein